MPKAPGADDAAIAAVWDRARQGLRFFVRGFGKVKGGDHLLRTEPVDAKVLAALRKRGITVAASSGRFEGMDYDALKDRPPASRRAGDPRYLFLSRVQADVRPVDLGGQKAYRSRCLLELALLDIAEGRLLAGESFDLGEETKAFRPDLGEAIQESVGKLSGLAEARIEEVLDTLFLYVGERR